MSESSHLLAPDIPQELGAAPTSEKSAMATLVQDLSLPARIRELLAMGGIPESALHD